MDKNMKDNLNEEKLVTDGKDSADTDDTQLYKSEKVVNLENPKNKWYDYLLQIITASTTVLAMIASFKKYTYSLNAENYYGIPHRYFENNIISELIFIISFIIFLLAIYFIPLIIKYFSNKKTFKITRFERILYPILTGFCNFYILFILLVSIFNISYKYQIYILLLCLIISIVLGIYSYKVMKRIYDKKIIYNKVQENEKNIGDVNYNKDIQDYLIIALLISLSIVFLIIKRFSYDPSSRKDYEIFNDQDGKAKIIIDSNNEKAITMDYYEILNENTFAIRQHNFKIQNLEDKEIKFINIGPLYNKEFSKLTLDLNGGEFNNNSSSLEYAIIKNYKISELEKLVNNLFTDSKPSKNGRKLLYWSTTEDGKFNYFEDNNNKLFDISSDITLYAHYE